MKLFIAMLLATLSTSVSARRESGGFNEALLKGVREDVAKDDQAFRKSEGPSRAPASAPTTEELVREAKQTEKIDRQLNQMGKPSW